MSKSQSRPYRPDEYRRLDDRCTARVEVFAVPSRSEPGVEHTVIRHRRPDSWGCDCKARVRCAHIDLVEYEERALPWRRHWAQAPDLSLLLVDREFAGRAATLTADERLQWETAGDEIARRALSLDAVAALLRAPGLDEARAVGRKAVGELFGD